MASAEVRMDRLSVLVRSLSPVGMLVGALFLAASLTPSLLPRGFVLQGALSGLACACGYLVGLLLRWLWNYLELPPPSQRAQRWALLVLGSLSLAIVVYFLWQAAAWQDSIRAVMQLEPLSERRPFEVGGIALLVFALVLALARLVLFLHRFFTSRLERRLPRRSSRLLGGIIVGILLWTAIDGVLFRAALRVADSTYGRLDALMEADVIQPRDPMKTGSAASLLGWEGLGRMGRSFIATGPRASDISAFTGRPAMEPLRVYAGLNSAGSVKERVALALAELQRVGGFERSILVIITPTGTGWVDPAAVDPLEYLHEGNVASVGLQYSYLASWLSLLVEPDYGADAARALFTAVYRHWTTLPHDHRPRLYLYGLSLGALNSDRSADIYDVIADPFQGALWTGPPFPSPTWRWATAERDPGSPAWLPRFRDGSVIRFANQYGGADVASAPWGPIRFVYLQHASDPIVFFEPDAGYREPAWMIPPLGPDVSPSLHWFPVVTLLQLGLDMALATTAPMGYGHVYAPEDHIDPWIQVTQPPAWAPAEVARLKEFFRAKRQGG